MATRVRAHEGDHTWALKSQSGVCGLCMEITHRRLPLKMKWICTVDGCKAKQTTRHKHVF
jgi:hypothetical protein